MLIHALFIQLAVFTAVRKRTLILTCPFLYIGIVSYHIYFHTFDSVLRGKGLSLLAFFLVVK